MKRTKFLGILGLAVVLVGLIAWPVVKVRQLDNHFRQVKANDSKDAVLKRMGTPWKDEHCGELLGGMAEGCIEEFVYANPYAPLLPEYWVVEFNSNHRVINTTYTTSP